MNIKPNILCIETVLGKCSVALEYNGLTDFLITKENFVQSEMLVVLIQSLLDKHHLQYENFNLISCTIGPGSFAGIRAGITAVRTIQSLLSIQAIGINTLELMAFAGFPVNNFPAAVVLKHGNKFYVNEMNNKGKLVGDTLIDGDLTVYKSLITTEPQLQITRLTEKKVIGFDAMTVLNFTKKIIGEGNTKLYDKTGPIYVSEPTITESKHK